MEIKEGLLMKGEKRGLMDIIQINDPSTGTEIFEARELDPRTFPQ